MEIIIRTIENKTSKTGTPFWVIEATDGKYTVWDKKIADELYNAMNKGERVNVDIKVSGDFKNIRGINTGGAESTPSSASSPAKNPTKDISIVAQCLCKAVMGQVDSSVGIEDAVKMYKHAVEMLE